METVNAVTIMGNVFEPMTQTDFYAFAGAEEGSYIAYTDYSAMILSPDGTRIAEVFEDGTQADWTVPYNPFKFGPTGSW